VGNGIRTDANGVGRVPIVGDEDSLMGVDEGPSAAMIRFGNGTARRGSGVGG